MPCELGTREIGSGLSEFHPYLFQPIDRIARLFNIGLNQTGVSLPVGIIHEHSEGLLFGKAYLPDILMSVLNGKGPHTQIAGAACCSAFFKGNDFRTFFRGGNRRRQSCNTCRDDNYV